MLNYKLLITRFLKKNIKNNVTLQALNMHKQIFLKQIIFKNVIALWKNIVVASSSITTLHCKLFTYIISFKSTIKKLIALKLPNATK